METRIVVVEGKAQEMGHVDSESIDLIVTSPPYPMIEMWDGVFAAQDGEIGDCLNEGKGREAFDLMHEVLDRAWAECYRVLKTGGLACINVGDATRKMGSDFRLYSNHSRILTAFLDLGFAALPDILWRKPSNAPTKFLGSGMLPAGAYVTYEHEYILVLRKGKRRNFTTPEEKRLRGESAYFWEERNVWFSDIWRDIQGRGQALAEEAERKRSAAFPFELAYRLICMFSVSQDAVLDPFLGTGTTLVAALASGRNAVGMEIDRRLVGTAYKAVRDARDFANVYTMERLLRHMEFVRARTRNKGPLKYKSRHYGFPVMTSQERDILMRNVEKVVEEGEGALRVVYGNGGQGKEEDAKLIATRE